MISVLHEGPSQLDGAPVVVLVTGVDTPSRNIKTGPLIQTWILRADVHPMDAIHSGQDASICGACVHRGRSCYVNVGWAPGNLWRAWRRGRVAPLQPPTGRVVRLGAYGDPVAAPIDAWRAYLAPARGWVGYTHQWAAPVAAPFKVLCMASVDTPEEAREARRQGWRTFRIRSVGGALSTDAREVVCPASDEAGKRTTCEKCRLCDGGARAKAPHVAIIAHGAKRGAYTQVPLGLVRG